MWNKFEDITNKKFERLTVIKYLGNYKYLCKCDCGNERIIYYRNLITGHTKSCGCLHKEKFTNKIHSLYKHKLYRIYYAMKQRCINTKNKSYKNYGGRGIKVCDEWKNDFLTFFKWSLNNGYKENAKRGKYTLDRIDNNGNYEPSNCRWISNKKQQSNKQNTIKITFNNETKTINEWAKTLKINKNTLRNRLAKGWDINRCFYQPIKSQQKHLL